MNKYEEQAKKYECYIEEGYRKLKYDFDSIVDFAKAGRVEASTISPSTEEMLAYLEEIKKNIKSIERRIRLVENDKESLEACREIAEEEED